MVIILIYFVHFVQFNITQLRMHEQSFQVFFFRLIKNAFCHQKLLK